MTVPPWMQFAIVATLAIIMIWPKLVYWTLCVVAFPFFFARNVWRRLSRPRQDRAPEHDFLECPICIHGEPFCDEGRAYMDHPSRHQSG